MSLYTYCFIWVCVLGLCLGSFYNVVILRSLSGESIVFPPSKCPKCGNKLYWWHNIPILSFLILRGKCYFCKEKISIQYPLIEFVTMVLFALSYWKFGLEIKTVFVLFWLSCLLIMTVTDLKEKLVDCNIAIALGISGVIYAFIISGWHGALHSILGIVAGVVIMELIARSGFIVAGTRAMGEADSYVAGALGAMFGIFSIVKVLLCSLVVSAIFTVPIFLYNRFKSGDVLTCVSAVLFSICVILFEIVWQNIFMLILIAILGAILVYSVLKGIRNSENRNYLPYVPALSVAALLFIFFLN